MPLYPNVKHVITIPIALHVFLGKDLKIGQFRELYIRVNAPAAYPTYLIVTLVRLSNHAIVVNLNILASDITVRIISIIYAHTVQINYQTAIHVPTKTIAKHVSIIYMLSIQVTNAMLAALL